MSITQQPQARACPVCCNTGASSIYHNRMAAVAGYDMSYTVACCDVCGFIFANHLPQEAQYEGYYRMASKYDLAMAVSAIDAARYTAVVSLCQSQVPRNAKIVDVGCGNGALMSYFSNAGWRDIHGIDPAPRAGEIARMLFQISTVAQGSMLDAASRTPLGVADLVCLTAVLEHLPTMRDHIDALVGQMKHGALLLVEVPALEAFDGDVGEPFGEFSLEHIQFFSRHSLEAFFASLGARLTAHCMVELPAMVGASHFALFQIGGAADSLKFIRLEADRATIERYVQNSQRRLIEAVKSVPDRPYFIYGAGSHTARLLPAVDDLCPRAGAILAIADGNRNLIGKSIGGHLIQGKEVFLSDRAAPILISSFRSQSDIAQQLRGNVPNPLVLLYPEQMGLE